MLIVREIKINKSILIFVLNFSKQINKHSYSYLLNFTILTLFNLNKILMVMEIKINKSLHQNKQITLNFPA